MPNQQATTNKDKTNDTSLEQLLIKIITKYNKLLTKYNKQKRKNEIF